MRRLGAVLVLCACLLVMAARSQAPQPSNVPATTLQAPDRCRTGRAAGTGPAHARLLGRGRAHRARLGSEVPRDSRAGPLARLHAAPRGASASCRLALRQGQRRWMLGTFKQWGLDAHIETFQVLFPTPKQRVVELVRRRSSRPSWRSRAVPGRSHVDPRRPSSFPALQRLLDRRRCDRAAGLRELRHARRTTSSSTRLRHLGQGRYRDRPLRRRRGAASSRRSPPSMAPSDASSTPIRETTATSTATSSRRGRIRPRTACSAAASPTCRSIRAIR